MSESEEVNKAESTLKPRSRFAFLLRPWCLIPVTILTILVAAVLGYRSSRLVGIPPIAEVVDRETEGRFPIEPEQNAFTYYEQALNQMPVLPEKLDPGILCQVLRDKGWEQAASRAVKCLGKCQVSLDLWKRGTTFDHGVRIQPADRNAYDDVSPLMYSNFIRLVILQSTRCLQEGNPEEASSWLRALFRFSRHLGNPGGGIDRLAGMTAHSYACGQFVKWAGHNEVAADHLGSALAAIRESYRTTPANSVTLKVEYLGWVKLLSSREEFRDYAVTSPGSPLYWSEPIVDSYLFIHAEPELTQVLLRHVYVNHLSQCDLRRWERTLATTGHDLYSPTGASPRLMDVKSLDEALLRSRLDIGLARAQHVLSEAGDAELARQTALELCLCVELFRRKHGEYPVSLQALVPEFLTEVPRDLYGSGPAERMLMTRRDIEEPAEEGDKNVAPQTRPWLIIYSRGINGHDDGGYVELSEDVGLRIPLPRSDP